MCMWCQTVYKWIWDEAWQTVKTWATQLIEQCSRQPCNWWCLCCNKWFCWIFAIIIMIIVFILLLILTLIVTVVCAACFIVCFVLCLLFWLFQQTSVESCLNWCNTGVLAPWNSEDRVDPQKPTTDDPPGPVGGIPIDDPSGLKDDNS